MAVCAWKACVILRYIRPASLRRCRVPSRIVTQAGVRDAHQRKGSYDEPVQVLKEVLRLTPLFGDTLYNLAAVYSRRGRRSALFRAYSERSY
jgi:hypothetical protein